MINDWNSYQDRAFYPLNPPSTPYHSFQRLSDSSITLISYDISHYRDGYAIYIFNEIQTRSFMTRSREIIVELHFTDRGFWNSHVISDVLTETWDIEGNYSASRTLHGLFGSDTYSLTVHINRISDTDFHFTGNFRREFTELLGRRELEMPFDIITTYETSLRFGLIGEVLTFSLSDSWRLVFSEGRAFAEHRAINLGHLQWNEVFLQRRR